MKLMNCLIFLDETVFKSCFYFPIYLQGRKKHIRYSWNNKKKI